ncbi:hypothetical protein F6P81_01190 [Streptococcus suis]|uniref:Uncharacterized protein n=1 Tax=Streptococcus suis TaxID=1307 RepID=A0A0Z8SP89_STRSU|nr:hypothetical protein [Streptococcus suis]MBS8087394.1 hypothetical protein [Streptococcus suis]MBS8110906.1 hypothetical protein [Streptococcus suis]MCB2924503.1 hypothetical protein [Streptococcus suis]NQK96203.1 hypothetical protein [Streptococcus suis]NQP75286.1 hypothetical protein [Streptococcus suis]
MTNKKLGVLLVDVPEPKCWKYNYLDYREGTYSIFIDDDPSGVKRDAYKCTQEEAKKYPQFKWVALEDLE